MNFNDKEALIYKINKGQYVYKLHTGEQYVEKATTPEIRLCATEFVKDFEYELSFQDLLSEKEALSILIDNNLWSEEEEKELEGLNKQIDQLKVMLFRQVFRTIERKRTEAQLQAVRSRISELEQRRNVLSHVCSPTLVAVAKFNYILANSLFNKYGVPVLDMSQPVAHFNKIVTQRNNLYITEGQYRELARSEPWRSFWNISKKEGRLFNRNPMEYTDEQSALVLWSSIYDSVFEHPESPPEFVVEDDDILDGWLLIQKEERQSQIMSKFGETAVETTAKSKLRRDPANIMFMANTQEDAQRIYSMNTPEARANIQQRFKTIQERGKIDEQEMPDTKNNIMKQLRESRRGK